MVFRKKVNTDRKTGVPVFRSTETPTPGARQATPEQEKDPLSSIPKVDVNRALRQSGGSTSQFNEMLRREAQGQNLSFAETGGEQERQPEQGLISRGIDFLRDRQEEVNRQKEIIRGWEANGYVGRVTTSDVVNVATIGRFGFLKGLGKKATTKGTQYIAKNALKKTAVKTTGQIGKQGIIGKAVQTGGNIFKSNGKSKLLTNKFLVKAGLTLAAASAIREAIGTYPFAGFIKEEALQTIGFAFSAAERNDDIQGMEEAIEFQEEILDVTAWENIIGKIPWANVQKQNKDFYEASRIKMEIDKRNLEKLKEKELEGDTESDFARERRESDEAARERQLANREEDKAFFDQQRAESRTFREQERQGFKDDAESRRQKNMEAKRQDVFFFEAIRKINAGQDLDEEDIETLKLFGVTDEMIERLLASVKERRIREDEKFGRSALNFGGVV